jgi:Dynamin family
VSVEASVTTTRRDLTAELIALIDDTRAQCQGSNIADRLDAIRTRLTGPLRVAIAGRVKAGKSTLLNALVGERLAPTDAGECTRLVSVYRQGSGYRVEAVLKSGSSKELAFRRQDGHLDIELGGLSESDIAHLEIEWPTSTLASTTLIDTPGLASINDDNSRRTREFLTNDASVSGSEADAVIYLMRHAHRSDIDFLDAFMDRSVSAASPVNAVGVLSRADEIGAGRRDAMDSARRIAERYAADEQLRTLCSTVVPLAGLLAETGLTWREDEMTDVRSIASTSAEVLERAVLSGDHFCAAELTGVTEGAGRGFIDVPVERRRSLLGRLGLYGLRLSFDAVAQGRANSAAELSKLLITWSGLDDLRTVIDQHFGPRARTLQARTALVSLRTLAKDLVPVNPQLGAGLSRGCEQIEATAIDFGRLRAAHLLRTATIRVNPVDRSDLERLLMAPTLGEGLGLNATPDEGQLRSAALESVLRWRRRAGDPMANPQLVEVCDIAARFSESAFIVTAEST